MSDNFFNPDRRAWLIKTGKILAGIIIGWTALPAFIRKASAMAPRIYPEGVYSLAGDVRINDEPAMAGATIKTGDVVSTGDKSTAVFVIGKDAFLVRDNSRIEFHFQKEREPSQRIQDAKILIRGKILSVFSEGRRTITTRTATIGVKGTGMYVETEPDRTYVCLCYGTATLEAASDPDARETIKTTHHDSPRYIHGEGADKKIVKAKMINHTDKELVMLESLVGRRPPFEDNPDYYY